MAREQFEGNALLAAGYELRNVPLTLYIHASAEYFQAWSRVVPGVPAVSQPVLSPRADQIGGTGNTNSRTRARISIAIAIARVYARDSISNTLAFRAEEKRSKEKA